jgi:DNA-binding SARP family transcriptional activator
MAERGVVVRVLGPVQLVADGGVVDLPSASQRRLMAALAVHSPHPVRLDWLCWALGVSKGALRTTVARLRRIVGDDVLATTATGYRLVAPVDAMLACSELAVADGDPSAIRAALARWIGAPLAEFSDEPWAAGEVARLVQVYASAVEDLAEVLIATHRADEAIVVLEPHVHTHEFRDRPRGLLIRALAATGRRTEALRRYQEYRGFLAEHAGLEVSEAVQRIERRVAAGWDGVEPDPGSPNEVPRRAPERRAPVPPAPVAEIVGRQRELDVLMVAADEAERGGLQVVLVDGEAGIGKTALLAAFARVRCDPEGWRVATDRCDEFLAAPFQPFRGLVGRLVDDLPDEALTAHAAVCGGDLARLAPQLRRRVPMPARAGHFDDDPNTARHLLFQAVVDIVRRAAELAPLAVLVDDLHWAEPGGLHLLVHLVRELPDLPVLVVAGFRDTGDAAEEHLRIAIADLERLGARRIGLPGLDREGLRELVHARVAGSAGRDVGAVVSRLAADTAGNPLFAEHLLRHWSESGQLTVDSVGVTVSDADSGEPPSTIRDVVWRRVGTLGTEGRAVLSVAAVLGVEFEEPLLASISGVDPAALERLLDRAAGAGLLAAPADVPGTSRFTHALVARVLEAELGDRYRARLHGAAFDALVDPGVVAGSGHLGGRTARLVHHAEQAGRIADAQYWAEVAGRRAMADLAADEAVGWFRRALAHATVREEPDTVRADLLVRAGAAEYRAGHPSALDTLHEGADLAERCGADQALLAAALAIDPGSVIRFGRFAPAQLAIAEAALPRVADDDRASRARVEALLAQSLVHTDQTARRTAAATSALDLARSTGDPAVLARVAPDVVMALWTPGTATLRSQVAAEAAAIVDTLGDPSLAATVHYAAHTAAVCAGDAAAARHHHARLRSIADEIEEPRVRWTAAVADAFAATMTCRFREAEAHMAEMLDLGTRIGEPMTWTIFAAQSFVLGTFEGRHAELYEVLQQVVDADPSIDLSIRAAHALVAIEVGDVETPRAMLHEALDRGLDAIPHDFVRSTTLLGYAVLALELDDPAAAASLLPAVVALAAEVSFNGVTSQGPIAAYAGKLLSLLGRHDEAEAHLTDALRCAEAFDWEYHRATTLYALARNRAQALGALDDEATAWLDVSEELCAAHGLAVWSRRSAALRLHHGPATAS